MENLLTPEQMADKLGVKLSTIRQWCHYKFIPYVKLGRFVRFRESAVQAWIEKRSVEGRTKRIPDTDLGRAR